MGEATGPCKSACITRSKGFQKLSRSCIIRSTNTTNSNTNAEGHSTTTTTVETSQCVDGDKEKYGLCDDAELCFLRRSRDDIATRRCRFHKKQIELSKKSNEGKVRGLPGQYSREFVDQSCQIFCQFEGHHPYLRWSRLAAAAPQETALRITAQEAAESQEEQTTKQSIEAYFPEGTWCHRDTRQIDYYCQNRECKP